MRIAEEKLKRKRIRNVYVSSEDFHHIAVQVMEYDWDSNTKTYYTHQVL